MSKEPATGHRHAAQGYVEAWRRGQGFAKTGTQRSDTTRASKRISCCLMPRLWRLRQPAVTELKAQEMGAHALGESQGRIKQQMCRARMLPQSPSRIRVHSCRQHGFVRTVRFSKMSAVDTSRTLSGLPGSGKARGDIAAFTTFIGAAG